MTDCCIVAAAVLSSSTKIVHHTHYIWFSILLLPGQ